MPYPIIDLHCDMLSYLSKTPNADPTKTEDIGCAIPYMKDGNVKIQTLAIYSGGAPKYNKLTQSQLDWFNKLGSDYKSDLTHLTGYDNYDLALDAPGTSLIASIENATVLADEDQPVDSALKELDRILAVVKKLLYISFTHHGENRFGGGNYTQAGLKDDGKVLLEYIAELGLTVDFSHTSDALAYGILEHIAQKGLDIKIIASHSNYRAVYDHPRNLPDDLAREIIQRNGLIGLNFLRAFMNNDNPDYLMNHIEHGLKLGGEKVIAFGADFFYTLDHPDYENRIPFYHNNHENALKYQTICAQIEDRFGADTANNIAHKNAMRFLKS